MINRANWKLVKAYMEYRETVDDLSEGSAKGERAYLWHILEWADDVSFLKVKAIKPTLPAYILSLAPNSEMGRYSSIHITKILSAARRMFQWVAANYPEYRNLNGPWIETLKAKRLEDAPKPIDFVSFDEIRRIASAPVENIIERRARASAVFLFLSGMRIGAFVTLPIKAVDLKNKTIKQYPSLGVRTKNGKYAITSLLDIPELLKVVQAWDDEIRALLPDTGYWFAPLSFETRRIELNFKEAGKHRESVAREDLRSWLDKVRLPYHSPHKFRHGHIHYGLERAKTMADLKAVSLNVMHANIKITDQTYSKLSAEEVHMRVEKLSKAEENGDGGLDDDIKVIQKFLEWRRNNG